MVAYLAAAALTRAHRRAYHFSESIGNAATTEDASDRKILLGEPSAESLPDGG